ncbi:hypothetical protein HGG76_27020 [Ochrobactrum tritici]|uniref:Uncharacterized protein n=1 Tax=Brucella tritici TaxID=94626 RepID=A0A7X6FSX4_9HYPH|nr:hypothetical protein [Brucella tritici]
MEAKADKRQADIESEQQRLNVESAKPASKEGTISKEQRHSEIDKALTKAKEADSDFKHQVKGTSRTVRSDKNSHEIIIPAACENCTMPKQS